MPAITVDTTQSFTLHAVVKFTNISGDTFPNLIPLLGDWKLQAAFPPDRDDLDAHLAFCIRRPSFLNTVAGTVGPVEVKLQLQSLYSAVNIAAIVQEWNLESQFSPWKRFSPWKVLWEGCTPRRDDGFQVVVDIQPKSAPQKRPVLSDPTILHNISRLIQGSENVRIKFLLFSRRRTHPTSTGAAIVGAQDPRAVYVTSVQIENQCDYFDTILENHNFSESKLVSFDEPPVESWVETYDYDSDSDLGYFSEDEDDGLLSDRESSCSDESMAGPNRNQPLPATPDQTAADDDNRKVLEPASLRSSDNVLRIGKVVAIKDTAYVTWRAMIYYLCTSQLAFAPLTSHGSSRQSRARTATQRQVGLPPRPSAKSMYRLADKLGLDDLAELALEHIRSQLSLDILFRELCSHFTSQHKGVRDMELAFAFQHWNEIKNSQVLHDMVADITSGAFPHAKEVLVALLTKTL